MKSYAGQYVDGSAIYLNGRNKSSNIKHDLQKMILQMLLLEMVRTLRLNYQPPSNYQPTGLVMSKI